MTIESDRIGRIRQEERNYHEACYEEHKLFEPGSWLHKPVKAVMETLARLDQADGPLIVLDLGCGVGRNSIPIASRLQGRDGKVVCVDILQSALDKLHEYGEQYGVRSSLDIRLSDIGDYVIEKEAYDYIVAVSTLEHVRSGDEFLQMIDRMIQGTKRNGAHCILINTNVEERDAKTGERLEVQMELNLETAAVQDLFSRLYREWDVLEVGVKPMQFPINRHGRDIVLKSDVVTLVSQKRAL